jgi:hypothetical protein
MRRAWVVDESWLRDKEVESLFMGQVGRWGNYSNFSKSREFFVKIYLFREN